MEYLIALYEISKKNKDGVTREELAEYRGILYYNSIFESRDFSKEYIYNN